MRNDNSSNYFIWGKNPSLLCLLGKKREINRIYAGDVEKVKKFIRENDLKIESEKIEFKTNAELDNLIKDKNARHQGIVLEVKNRVGMSFDLFLQLCRENEQSLPRLLILDEVVDPRNVGAVMRTAAAFGIGHIMTATRRAAGDAPAIAKTSAGYSEMVELIEVVNLNHALEKLKKVGYFVMGLDGSAGDDIKKFADPKNICLVLGNEGRGLRNLVKKNCDFLCGIKIRDNVESLNVSVACAIAVYQLWS
ncbi:MAG: 23S rRNA (guanosine(2251)-2'-O)-methyltransferase RlmB [Rickettsiales bacterium]|jgi:23S rRNA (guanosine2251-2'-O)-methyltransferase|nr:23S rRNA (guanosine(2251)-2'-O)-methyltransferase RlmB [Rickettsiales bacterium]